MKEKITILTLKEIKKEYKLWIRSGWFEKKVRGKYKYDQFVGFIEYLEKKYCAKKAHSKKE